jgi:hypothetical protein
MKKTAKYYKENPEARKKKAAYDKKYNAKPDQKKKRAELNKINRDRGTYGNGDKKDASHTKSGVVMKPQSANRGSKSDQPGDRRARGKKK